MDTPEIQDRFIAIETDLTHLQKSVDELSEMLIKQGKTIDYLLKQNEWLKNRMEQDVVKPQEEETPPPHY